MKDPLVSIIITTYNAEKFIEKTLESVFSQTYKNWELIIVDDCSKDRTLIEIKNFIKNSHNKMVIKKNKQNLGSQSRNVGINQARGKYLAFIDHDDRWLPEKLEIQVKFHEFTTCPVSCTYYRRFNKKGFVGKLITTPKKITYQNLLIQNTIGFSSVMVNFSILNNFSMFKNKVSDHVTWLNLLKNNYEIKTVKKDLMRYYYDSSTGSGNKFSMAKEKWYILRNIEKISTIVSVIIMIQYFFKSLWKYRTL